MEKKVRLFGVITISCAAIFALVGFLVGWKVSVDNAVTLQGGSSIQPQYVDILSAWVYVPNPVDGQVRIEILSEKDVFVEPVAFTGVVGDVIDGPDSTTITILAVDTPASDAPPGSGSALIKISRSSIVDARIAGTGFGVVVGVLCGVVIGFLRKRTSNNK